MIKSVRSQPTVEKVVKTRFRRVQNSRTPSGTTLYPCRDECNVQTSAARSYLKRRDPSASPFLLQTSALSDFRDQMPLRYLLWDERYISRRSICLVSIGAPTNTTLIIIISQGSAVLKHFANFCFHLDSLFPRTKTLPHSLLTGNTHTSETAAISTVGIVGSK